MVTAAIYLFQGLKLKGMTDRFINGGNKLMVTIVILAEAWPISDVSQDLGLIVINYIHYRFLPYSLTSRSKWIDYGLCVIYGLLII